VRYTKWGRFTKDFHFIDAKDNPPSYCGVEFERDCKQDERGCIVTALANYTARLLDTDLHPAERAVAAKFVVHFVSDMHQPLHTENVERGGNGIQVLFDGRRLNLHHVWDTSIAEKFVGGVRRRRGGPFEEAKKWADELTREIEGGKFAGDRIEWLREANLSDVKATAMAWAREGNAYVCTTGEYCLFVYCLGGSSANNLSLSLARGPGGYQRPGAWVRVLRGRRPRDRAAGGKGGISPGCLVGLDRLSPNDRVRVVSRRSVALLLLHMYMYLLKR
jgi:hypothetical protein